MEFRGRDGQPGAGMPAATCARVLATVLAVALGHGPIGCARARSHGEGAPMASAEAAEPAAFVSELDRGHEPLRTRFEADGGRARVLVLASPS